MSEPGWPALPVGAELRVVKLSPDGTVAASYPATVIEAGADAPWLAVKATWVQREHNLNGLLFLKGDELHEFFSPVHPFNLFSVFAPDGALRGWYANVTHPTRLDRATDPPTLTWHDLYLDVVALPSGLVVVRDEDELAEAGLQEADPTLYQLIVDARDELLRRWAKRVFPFHEG